MTVTQVGQRLSRRQRRCPTIEAELRETLAAVARQDLGAFPLFYAQVSSRVYGLAKIVLGNHHLAEETTQEVLVEVWTTSARRYVPERGRVMPWLMMITHRRAVDRVRAVRAARTREETYARLQQRLLPGPCSDPDEQTLRRQSEGTLRHAMDLLPAHQRQPLLLAYFGGYSHVQVAELLGVPLGTAKSRLTAGLHALHRLLPDQ